MNRTSPLNNMAAGSLRCSGDIDIKIVQRSSTAVEAAATPAAHSAVSY
jgi:hypothetical protein